MLTFFSLLVAAYLVFSSQALQASFSVSTRNIKAPNPNALLDEALMTLLRGTGDVMHPFFGEDLLSDFYGRNDFLSLQVRASTTPTITNRFVRISIAANPAITGGQTIEPRGLDDVYAGRIITFTNGLNRDQSYRVLRSISTGASLHDLIFEARPEFELTAIVAGTTAFHMNGIPRNSPGIGFNGTNVQNNAPAQPNPFGAGNVGLIALPAALQPNHFRRSVNKGLILTAAGSDFDEEYDASDFNNWYLSHVSVIDLDGNGRIEPNEVRIIPSYHRPSVINYILNENNDWRSFSDASGFRDVVASLARGTMRPIPIASAQFSAASTAINGRFTGGNSNFALRTPLLINSAARLDQLAKVLTGNVENPWDVDNDGDGINDSVWVDIGLPLITSPEGKLLRPLVAPMIEDLSGRLNVNAHGNFALNGASTIFNGTFNDLAGGPTNPTLFRGLGFGPAEIGIPVANANTTANLLFERYRSPSSASASPGVAGVDSLSALTDRMRPSTFNANTLQEFSVDPYGRGGIGISPQGSLVAKSTGTALTNNTATTVTEPDTNEASDTPYEFDPTGKLTGDNAFSHDELEAILRRSDFDHDVLPRRLINLAEPIIASRPDIAWALTTISKSDDSVAAVSPTKSSAAVAFADLISVTMTNIELKKLIAPEIRLGRKLDLNRPFGNGIDDSEPGTPGFGVVDEPSELFPENGMPVELTAFESYAGNTIPSEFTGIAPKYDFDETVTISARQLLARHLYVLMMTISYEMNNQIPTFGDMLTPAVPVSNREAYRARRLAQWAVNVVDYRDNDSIMTAFEFDSVISDGSWNVDGNLLTNEGAHRGVVWGVESPELIFTESLALHDVRVRDSDLDTEGRKGMAAPDEDDDTDQMRVPQGSLFLELYNPRLRKFVATSDASTAGIPRELYNVDTSGANVNYSLDLDATVQTFFDNQGDVDPLNDVYGDTTGPSVDVPVWRIAISEPHFQVPEEASSPLVLRDTLPDTLSFEPSRLDELGTATNSLALERFVFFNHFANLGVLTDAISPIPDIDSPSRVFFSYNNVNAQVEPEQYFSVVPRFETRLGSQQYVANAPVGPSPQRFLVRNAAPNIGLMHDNLTGTQTTLDASRTLPGAALVFATFPNLAWTDVVNTAPEGVGLNVSEPLPSSTVDYYIEPTQRYSQTIAAYNRRDAYVELDTAGVAAAGAARDQPEDMRLNGPIRELTSTLVGMTVTDPMLGTIENYRTAFLQRLADPTRGFHPTLNPYLTMDQIAIDLTIFSGEDSPSNVTSLGNAPSTPTRELLYVAGSRQRDGRDILGVGTNILFSYSTNIQTAAALPPSITTYFGANLQTTFNYLNSGYGLPQDIMANRGRPLTPFAIHPWLNRPFASPFEVLLVPACSQGRLFEEFSVVAAGVDPPIYPDGSPAPTEAIKANLFLSPFRHLLNFFHSKDSRESPVGPEGAEFASLFDFVSARSYFRGEIDPIVPTRITAATGLTPLMQAPFNLLVPTTRIGTVNLNTLPSESVWLGLMNGHLNSAENQLSFDAFLESRRGYAVRQSVGSSPPLHSTFVATPPTSPPASTPIIPPYDPDSNPATVDAAYNYDLGAFDPRYPTQFAGVFRYAHRSNFALNVRDLFTTEDTDTPGDSDADSLRRRSVNATLLRGKRGIDEQEGRVGTGEPTATALFVRDATETPTDAHLNRQTNPFLRYQTLMRMPNLASDNSQSYLVRLTMGFFEVDANNTDSLGAEYKEVSGENQRYKAMFIIDRSIPVGFIPGQDLNARDTVVFERFYQ